MTTLVYKVSVTKNVRMVLKEVTGADFENDIRFLVTGTV